MAREGSCRTGSAIAGTSRGQSYGLEIFDVQFRREARGHGTAGPDRSAGTGGDRRRERQRRGCANVSRDLSAILDVEDVVPMAYTLEVSSPGLDRPLRRADDYERFAGRRAKLVMREAIDGQRYFKGRLGGVETATTC